MSFTLLFVLLVPPVLAAVNLLKNPDFEKNTFSQSNGEWYASGCTTVLSRDSFTGAHSVYVSHRTGTLTGMYQNVKLTAGRNYYFKAHIKLLNVPAGQLTENVNVIASTHTAQSQSHFMISMNKLMQPNIWQVVGGDFSTPHESQITVRIHIQTQNATVNYLLDASSLVLIPQLPPNWKSTASATIDRIRKADINIRVQGHHSLNDLQDVTAEIVQNRHEFGFGSAVKASYMTDSTHSAYQKAFYDNFEWATIENKLKWRLIERSKGHIDYDTGLNAINALLAKGIKIRAHNLFWDRSDRSPAWLHGKTGNALLQEMKTRINGIVTKTKGKVESWDVNNENLHNNYFEIGTGNVNITMWMFQEAHKVDPNVKLFLNDFNIISRGFSTQDYYNQATLFKARRDVHLYGIGIQSHMKQPFDISVIKYRLDQIAAVGLPIWISELDLPVHDVNERANDLEDLFTLFFSTQQIKGIMLWGFWDGAQTDPNKALFNGNSVQPNAAGLRYQKLVKKDWKTNESASLASGHAHVRGFKGEYTLRVKRQGHLLKEEHFTLSGSGVNLRVSVSGTEDMTSSSSSSSSLGKYMNRDDAKVLQEYAAHSAIYLCEMCQGYVPVYGLGQELDGLFTCVYCHNRLRYSYHRMLTHSGRCAVRKMVLAKGTKPCTCYS